MIEYALLIYAVTSGERVNNYGPATLYLTEAACEADRVALMRLAPDWDVKCLAVAVDKKRSRP